MDFQQFDVNSPWYPVALDLRNQVLRLPIGLNLFDEDLTLESGYFHFGMIREDELIGYALTKPDTNTSVILRQMCVHPEVQGMGIGRALLTNIEKVLVEKRIHEISLAARSSAIPFYEKLEYRTYGSEYLSVGIPHIRMKKKL